MTTRTLIIILAFFLTASAGYADGVTRVSCDNHFFLEAALMPGTYRLSIQNNNGSWPTPQEGFQCTFKRDPYESFMYFDCANQAETATLVDYNRECFPADNPHHESCEFYPVIKLTAAGGTTQTLQYSQCNFE